MVLWRIGSAGSLAAARVLVACALLQCLPAARAASTVALWPAGAATPALALPDLDGRLWSLDAFKGRVVLLNFWASWCEPCRAEMPALAALARRHGPGDLVVLGVNFQEGAGTVRRFLASIDQPFFTLLDRDGDATKAWTRRIFPTTVVVDREGRARQIVTGEYDWSSADAQRLLQPWLAAR